MTDSALADDVIEQLQAFGLKTYEARCFVALSRVPQATAREISEITDVPRTRVYDAVGTLEDQGLVSIQHTNPQLFRAVELEEAIETLRRTYESRLQSVQQTLEEIEPATVDQPGDTDTEVWMLSGQKAITARTERLLAEADDEIWVLIDATVCDSELLDSIEMVANRQVQTHIVVVGSNDQTERLPDEVVCEPSEECLQTLGFPVTDGGTDASPDRAVTRLIVADQREALVATNTTETHTETDEQSVYAAGKTNGVVVMTRNVLVNQFTDTAEI